MQINGVESSQSAWSLHGDDEQDGAQIDLIISRKDNVVNLCEMKFYSEDFTVTKDYHKTLVHRANLLEKQLPKKASVQSVLVTTYGLAYNDYSSAFVSTVTLDDLFR